MSHLTIQDRHKIENLLDNNKTPTEIAELLGRNHSTIIRELKNIAMKIWKIQNETKYIAPI